jgi:hypothetical protein
MNNAGMDGYSLIDDELDDSVEPLLNWIVVFSDESELDYSQVTPTEMQHAFSAMPEAVDFRRVS